MVLKDVHEPATQVSPKHEQVLKLKISVDNWWVIPKLSTPLCIDMFVF
jgi:hypothetical protein